MAQQRKPRGIPATSEGIARLQQAKASCRDENGKPLTFEKIAERAGVDKKTVTKFFNGTGVARDSMLCIISVFGLDASEIVDLTRLNQLSTKQVTKIDWQAICRDLLQSQRDLASNLFGQNLGICLNLDDIHVPLGLVERKRRPKHEQDVSPEFGSQVYQGTIAPEDSAKPEQQPEIVTNPIEYDQFFQKILAQGNSPTSQGKRLTIIGEPGAGKTTQLLKIADWILAETDGIPLWISLATLGDKSLSEYLRDDWLRVAAGTLGVVSTDWLNGLEAQLASGRVWLLLDGADEMTAIDSPLASLAKALREPLFKQVRVVLSCRLNLWEAGTNALGEFDTYKMLDFSYCNSHGEDQVKQFIDKWFTAIQKPMLASTLRLALDQPGKERIKDLARNPLRLSLLCLSWQGGQGQLPDTKADLYQLFVDALYELKKAVFPTTAEQRSALNQALGKLALTAIERGFKSLLPETFVQESLTSTQPHLFELACQLGWLNRVSRDANNPLRSVYAFFHPTFQEYFAALAISDWDYFLPRDHVDCPVEGKPYRIFEPQWQEVILLWLGREDIELNQKEAFITALMNFEDGCGQFYSYRANFLASRGMEEFRQHSQVSMLTQRFCNWLLGSQVLKKDVISLKTSTSTNAILLLLTDENSYFREIAAESLQGTTDSQVITALVALFKDEDSHFYFRGRAAKSLQGTTDPQAIAALVTLLKDEDSHISIRERAAAALQGTTDLQAVNDLVSLLKDERSDVRSIAAIAFQGTTDPQAIAALVALSSDKDSYVRRRAAMVLQGTTDSQAIAALVALLKDEDSSVLARAAVALRGTTDSQAITALVSLLKDENYGVRCSAADALQGTTDPQTVAVLVALLKDERSDVRDSAAIALQGTTDPQAFALLVALLKDESINVRNSAAKALQGTTDPQAIAALVALLRDKDSYARERATAVRQGITNHQTLTTLFINNAYVREQAAVALRGTTDLQSLATLFSLLEDNDCGVRTTAMEFLQSVTSSESQSLLIRLLPFHLSECGKSLGSINSFESLNIFWRIAQNLDYPSYHKSFNQLNNLKAQLQENSKLAPLLIDASIFRQQYASISPQQYDPSEMAQKLYNLLYDGHKIGTSIPQDISDLANLKAALAKLKQRHAHSWAFVFYKCAPSPKLVNFLEQLSDVLKIAWITLNPTPSTQIQWFHPEQENLVDAIEKWLAELGV